MSTVKYPGGYRITERPDSRGFYRVRGPGADKRFRHFKDAEQWAWAQARPGAPTEVPNQAPAGPQNSTEVPTVTELADAYLASEGRPRPLADNTVRTTRNTFGRWLLPVVGDLPCTDWDREATLAVYRRCVDGGLKPSTVSKVMADASALAAYGRERGAMRPDQKPVAGLIANQRPALSGDALPTHADVERMADALVAVTRQDWRALQVWLLAYGGLRAAELIALRPEDVRDGTVRIERQLVGRLFTDPKHGIHRTTIYPAWLGPDLEAYVASRPAGGPLWPSARGGYEPYSTWLRQRWHPASDLAGWPRLPDGRRQWTAHTLRHYFGTWACAGDGLGMDVGSVAMFMGHHSPEVTHNSYVQSRPDRFGRARAATRSKPDTERPLPGGGGVLRS